jgi:hypothetical protein
VANDVALSTLRTKCRTRGEISSNYWNDTKLNQAINDARLELWDEILGVPGGRDFLMTTSRAIAVSVARSGTGDSIAISGSTCTLTDAAGAFLVKNIGNQLTISSAIDKGNEGTFRIRSRTSTTLVYDNPDGVADAVGGFAWSINSTTVGLPADCGGEIYMVEVSYDNGWRMLRPFNLTERADETVVTQSEKLGTEYRVMEDALLLSPTPTWSGDLRIFYAKVPVALSADADTSDFVFGWDRFVWNKVCQMHARARGEDKSADSFRDDAMLALNGIKERAKRRTPSANFVRDDYSEQYYNRYPWLRRR